MGSRTDRFGFVTFDTDADDLAFHNHQAFVADRISMDRLLRIACEAHTHTGIRLSETPPAAPELSVLASGGSLPPNHPVYYKVAVVDGYGQERLASAAAVAYTPAQVFTPTAPTLVAAPGGTLWPGDYQYAVSAYVGNPDDETGMSNITTGSLIAPNNMWTITFPSPPSGATGWNLYRKAPMEVGFARLASWDLNDTAYDNGSRQRGFQRSPLENTTNVTSSIIVTLPTPLGPNQTAKIYRTLDAGDWDQSLVTWTPTLPYTDQGFPTSPGYPPDVSAGVGGAPKIRLGIDTTGLLPPNLNAPTQIPLFNMTGPVQIGHWPWQWINELDTFHLLGLRASLGRGSSPYEQKLRVALEVRFAADPDHWIRYVDQNNNPIYVEIAPGRASGTLQFPNGAYPAIDLHPGDGLRVAVVQSGDNPNTDEPGTDRDLSVAVIGAGIQGWRATPATYTLTFNVPPEGAPPDGKSPWLDVEASTDITAVTWKDLPEGTVIDLVDENTGHLAQVESPPTSGAFDMIGWAGSTGTLPIAGPTRIRAVPRTAVGGASKVTLTLLGTDANEPHQRTPPNSTWPPPVTYEYWLESEWGVWNHLVFREGWIGPGPGATSQRANFYLPTYGEVDQVQAVVGDPSGMDFIITVNRGSHEIYKPYGPFSGAVPGVAWTNVASPPYGFAQVLERDYLQIDIWEGSSSYWDQPGPPDGSTTVKARVHIINAWAPVPDGWAGTPGYEVSFEGSPFDSIAYDPGPP